MNKGIVLIFFSLLSVFSFAGTGDQFNQDFFEANQLMEEKLWNRAASIWEKLVAEDQFNGNINYKLGYCMLQTAKKKLDALPYLETAVNGGISKNYDPFDASESKAPVEAKFYYGKALHLDYRLDEAIVAFSELLEEVPTKHILTDQARRQIEMCKEAKLQVANPKNFIITNVGPVINNEFNDYSPVISLDETSMFFTSRRLRIDSTNVNITDDDTGEMKEDIYVSYKNQANEWMEPELLNINTDSHAASIGSSIDAQSLYIYYDENGDGNIFMSKLIGESWTTPEAMGSDINTEAWETHITVSSDEKSLYFISDRNGGYGGRDIYRCVKLPDDTWSKALNLGPNLNTPYDEDAVFLSADGRTMYFSSKGHNSIGDFDIFYSQIGDDGEWSEPTNLGYPLNTTDADIYFYPVDGKTAYYSSAKDEGYGLQDIYRIEMPESTVTSELSVLKGYVYPAEGEKLPENCLVVVTNKASGEVTEYTVRQRDGSYIAILPPCVAYEIEYFVNDELVEEEFINVPCESGYRTLNKEVFLLPVQLEKNNEPSEEEIAVCDEEVRRLRAQVELLTEKLLKATEGSKEDFDLNDLVPDSGNETDSPENTISPENTVSPEGNNDSDGNSGNDDSPISSEYDEINAKASYERYFVYDFNDFGAQERKFEDFANNLEKIIEAKGEVTVYIEASASSVPSSRYKNNGELAKSRAEKAKQQVLDAAKKRGIDISKIKFAEPLAHVQGPSYNNDAVKNRTTYELYQYIKIQAE